MKVGLLGLSNPCKNIESTQLYLKDKGYDVVVSPFLDQNTSGYTRAMLWNEWMQMDFDYIFDVSGGDLANETIPYLDLDIYKNSHTIFCGYSDLTCVLNILSIIRPSLLYQVKISKEMDTSFDYAFLQGTQMKGIVVGGNIRCFLKLAGTPYFPDCKNKILFLESYSGNENRIRTYFAQLKMIGVFDQINGLILGQFSELDEKGISIPFNKEYYNGPIIRTMDIGHGKNSKAIWIGKELQLCSI